MVTLQLRQLHVPPGQRLLIEDVTWADFEAIVEELGEHRGTRVAYSQGVLEIVSPLPAHEKAKVIISDLVKILLDELDMPARRIRFDEGRIVDQRSMKKG